MISNLPVEIMDHLNLTLIQEDWKPGAHPTQNKCKHLIVYQLFIVQQVLSDHSTETKMVAVRIPPGIPIYRVRFYTPEVEKQLESIYDTVIKANFCLVSEEDSRAVSITKGIPSFSVVYV